MRDERSKKVEKGELIKLGGVKEATVDDRR